MSSEYCRIGNPEEMICALATPLEGHSLNEILDVLRQHQVQESSQLSESTISTRAPRQVLQALALIARVEPKVRHIMHRR